MRRLLALLAATATLAASLLAVGATPAYADEGSNTCSGATSGFMSGTVSPSDQHDWWAHSSQANRRTFNMSVTYDDSDLEIYSVCGGTPLCTSRLPADQDETCTITVSGPVKVHVVYFLPGNNIGISNYTISVTVPPECSDGYDNDGDSLSDYPIDPGCADPNDTSELNGPCDPGALYCVTLTPGSEALAVPVASVGTVPPGVRIAGFTDVYHFDVAEVEVNIPCVALIVGVAADPCAVAGGVPIGPRQWLVDMEVLGLPAVGPPITTLHVCNATLRVTTVNNIGIQSAPALMLCP